MMKTPASTSGYYLFPVAFLALGIWQLSFPEGRLAGIAFVAVAIIAGIAAFGARRRSQNQRR